ncbi:VOC family protein [Hufsiella ginkgonis]|uniref:Glyoxalase n=1 Tax=Hufsiella ginkgonis TaxID=2695274 RepID=A0A7K1XSN8_9SPHI|nr:VOC family protein [Hufsiella ginkgonis]MXV13759.1 glyoxalase [Hufsiella ginkgonis]
MKAIEIISIPVTDQQKAKQFYVDLGFTVLVEAPFEGDKQWIQLGFPGSDLSITLVTWFENMSPGCINGLVIKTDDLEKDREALTAKGISVGQTDQTPWGLFAAVNDPDGNRLSLHQDIKPR